MTDGDATLLEVKQIAADSAANACPRLKRIACHGTRRSLIGN
jgi:hypothetical protein